MIYNIALYVLAAIGFVCVSVLGWMFLHETWLSFRGESGRQILSKYLDDTIADMQSDYMRGLERTIPLPTGKPRTVDWGTIKPTPNLKLIEGKR